MPVVYVASYSIQGFRYFMRSQTRKIQINPRNPAKFPKKHKIPRNPSEILQNILFIFYFILFATLITKKKKKKWRGDLTETIGAYERLGLLEL